MVSKFRKLITCDSILPRSTANYTDIIRGVALNNLQFRPSCSV